MGKMFIQHQGKLKPIETQETIEVMPDGSKVRHIRPKDTEAMRAAMSAALRGEDE